MQGGRGVGVWVMHETRRYIENPEFVNLGLKRCEGESGENNDEK